MKKSPADSPGAHLHPDLSALMDKSAEEWSAPEIQNAARAALQQHAPDREPLTRTTRFGVLPWLHRNDAVCRECGGTYPCITHRAATQLLSAGRISTTRPPADHDLELYADPVAGREDGEPTEDGPEPRR
jgi:hypothetical protein